MSIHKTIFYLLFVHTNVIVILARCITMTVGENIRRIRKEKHLSQRELGKKLGISQQMIGQYENNPTPPKLETVRKIAKVLNVSVSELDPRVDAEIDSLELELRRLQNKEFEEFSRLISEEMFFSEKYDEIIKQYDPKIKELYMHLKELSQNTPKQHLYETSGETLKRLRNEYKASLQEIFQSTGIPINLIERYENDERTLSLDHLSKIADYYGVPMNYISARVANSGFSVTTEQDKLLEMLIFYYELLNKEGQEKAIEQIKLLLLIPQYCQPDPNDEYLNSDYETNNIKNISEDDNKKSN